MADSKGFTLLELIIVMAIASILMSVVGLNFMNSLARSRDAKRKNDIKIIQQSMEQYYSICGFNYPTSVSTGIICSSVTPTVALLPTMPVDPRTTTPYPFPTLAATSYQVCATLESDAVTNYCVTNQQ